MTENQRIEPIEQRTKTLLGQRFDHRVIVAVAAASGSGKTTFSDQLVKRLNVAIHFTSAVLPMDGDHYDDAIPGRHGLSTRKDAANAFDVAGLRNMLERRRKQEPPQPSDETRAFIGGNDIPKGRIVNAPSRCDVITLTQAA